MRTFLPKIDKQIVAEMPSTTFEGQILEVSTPEEAAEAVNHILTHPVVGIDTETRPAFKKGLSYPVALLQVATLTRCYLFRLHMMTNYDDIQQLFEAKQTIKVGLSIHDDIRALRGRIKNIQPQNCLDIQKMVNDYGIFELSLQKIFAIIFQHKISKAQRLTNWEANPLTPAQQQYAATDAWATLLLYHQLIRTPKITEKQKQHILQELALIEEERINAQKLRKEEQL